MKYHSHSKETGLKQSLPMRECLMASIWLIVTVDVVTVDVVTVWIQAMAVLFVGTIRLQWYFWQQTIDTHFGRISQPS